MIEGIWGQKINHGLFKYIFFPYNSVFQNMLKHVEICDSFPFIKKNFLMVDDKLCHFKYRQMREVKEWILMNSVEENTTKRA